jgi:methyl-accepting chemotaxis protein
MDHETLIAVFVVIAAVAIVLQMLILLGLYLVARRLQGEVSETTREVRQRLEATVQAVVAPFAESREQIKAVTLNVAEVSRIIRERTSSVDDVLAEMIERTRQQMQRIDQLISNVAQRVDSTASVVQRSVIVPFQEIAAITKGIQCAFDFFLSRRQPSTVREATQDEEMFI